MFRDILKITIDNNTFFIETENGAVKNTYDYLGQKLKNNPMNGAFIDLYKAKFIGSFNPNDENQFWNLLIKGGVPCM